MSGSIVSSPKKLSMLGTSFNLLNSILGAGTLSLPWAFSNTGSNLGIIFLVLFALFTGYSCDLLDRCSTILNEKSYAGIARRIYGQKAYLAVEWITVLFSFGACTGYLIIIGNEMEVFLSLVTGSNPSFLYSRTFALIMIVILIVLPLSLLKDLSSLKITSLLALVCILYLVGVIYGSAPLTEDACRLAAFASYSCEKDNMCVIQTDSTSATFANLANCVASCEDADLSGLHYGGETLETSIWSFEMFKSLPLFCFAYNCLIQMIPLRWELERPSFSRVRILIWGGMLISVLFYGVAAFYGYSSFCSRTKANILDNYHQEDKYVLPARLLLAIVLAFSFPLFSQAIRYSLNALLFGLDQSGQKLSRRRFNSLSIPSREPFRRDSVAERREILESQQSNTSQDDYDHDHGSGDGHGDGARFYFLTFCPVCFMLVVAIQFKQLDVVLGLTGATAGSLLVYIMPAIFYVQMRRKLNMRMKGLKLMADDEYGELCSTSFVSETGAPVSGSPLTTSEALHRGSIGSLDEANDYDTNHFHNHHHQSNHTTTSTSTTNIRTTNNSSSDGKHTEQSSILTSRRGYSSMKDRTTDYPINQYSACCDDDDDDDDDDQESSSCVYPRASDPLSCTEFTLAYGFAGMGIFLMIACTISILAPSIIL